MDPESVQRYSSDKTGQGETIYVIFNELFLVTVKSKRDEEWCAKKVVERLHFHNLSIDTIRDKL